MSINPVGDDLLSEILKRLPVRTLCRFRCICKHWKSFISSTLLINLHHTFTSSNISPPHLKPYLGVEVTGLCPDYFNLYCPQRDPSNISTTKFYFPFRYRNFDFIDVVHGLVFVSYSNFDSYILWNPAIRKYIVLPKPFLVLSTSGAIGFGYDTSKNDFKVVRIQIPYYVGQYSFPPTYEVYSTRDGLWRMGTADINLKIGANRILCNSCFVNGAIHWLISRSNKLDVLVFDCEREEFTTMELPEEISYKRNLFTPIVVSGYGGLLSVLVYSRKLDRTEMWVMEKGVDPNKWIKSVEGHCCDFNVVSSRYVYEESMFLMDDAKARSYTD